MDAVTTALTSLTVEGFKAVVKGAWSLRQTTKANAASQHRDLQDAYEIALRLMGSLLFEAKANIERVRVIVEKKNDGVTFGVFDFTVSDALMPDLCRVVPSPPVLESVRSILAAIRRVDFFQRLGGAGDLSKYGLAIAFADDAINKGIIERFNALVKFGNRLAGAVFEVSEFAAGGGLLFPEKIIPTAKIDHSLL